MNFRAALPAILVVFISCCTVETNEDFPAMDANQLRIVLHIPQDDLRPVYLTGNFNEWKPDDLDYKMEHKGEGNYVFIFDGIEELPDTVEYKYTRGGWDNIELDIYGNEPPNRSISKHTQQASDTVEQWKNNGMAHNSRYAPLINIIDENFEIPQLIKTRRITALLPWNYYETDRRYPVLYLQDGQNLFDDHAPFGSWGLDKRLAFLAEQGYGDFIVIAIDHAEKERIAEFTPTLPTSKLGIGDGKKYARFLTETLKPWIDDHFRTKPEPEYTGIGGSSMGALISIYAAMQHPEVYSRLMLFSPSFWVTPKLPSRFVHEAKDFSGKIYIYGGGDESQALVGRLENFYHELQSVMHHRDIQPRLSINPSGKHNEAEWSREFPIAAVWLYE